MIFATMRDTSGRNAATADALRSLASRKHWDLDVLDMDVTDEASVKGAVEQARDALAQMFRVPELTVLRSDASGDVRTEVEVRA
jgi:hypothetical protein